MCARTFRNTTGRLLLTFPFELLGYKRRIENFVAQMEPTKDQIEEFLQACEASAIPQWRALCEEGNALMADMTDAEELRWSKLFTEINITTETMVSPLQRRAYEKPLGYPGDLPRYGLCLRVGT